MARLVIFDKDGVVLDLQATWLPVARAVAAYTASLIPSNGATPQVTTADLLRAIGVDDAVGHIDPKGILRLVHLPRCAPNGKPCCRKR